MWSRRTSAQHAQVDTLMVMHASADATVALSAIDAGVRVETAQTGPLRQKAGHDVKKELDATRWADTGPGLHRRQNFSPLLSETTAIT